MIVHVANCTEMFHNKHYTYDIIIFQNGHEKVDGGGGVG